MRKSKSLKVIAIFLCILLIFQQTGFAQVASLELNLAGHFTPLLNSLTPDKFRPLHFRSISYDGLNNNFELFLDKGDTKNLKTQEIESTTKDLLNYFYVGMALPNDTFWVNLRPDSPNDIIDPLLAQTEVGKILLEADLQLKKDTANATNPGTPEGKEYWNKLYQKAGEIYGNQNITIPTLTRPWIVPDEIIIRESVDSAYVYKATLKVMLEQDYLKGNATYSFKDEREKQLNVYSAQIMREEIIPKLTKEINNAKRYAPLRQVYYSLILAQWFKARHKGQSPSGTVPGLIGRKDLSKLQTQTPYSVNTYFTAYKENFSKGEYKVKEPISTPYGQVIRSYFSGGIAGIAPTMPDLGGPALGAVTVVPEKRGADLSRRSAIDRFIARIKDYQAFEQSIREIIIKLEEGEPLSESEIIVLKDLRNRLILKNSLVAMQLKVHLGDMMVVLNQAAIKFLNTVISEPQVDRFIVLRQQIVTRLLLESELIGPENVDTLSLLFKQDKFVIKAGVVEALGRAEVLSRLESVAEKLTAELTEILRKEYPDKATIQGYVFLFNFGVSAPVAAESDDARILADIQALQAAKIARRNGLSEFMFNQEEFDSLMRQADKLWRDLGLALGELPSEDEMKEVRGKTEEELAKEISRGIEKAKRQLLLKRYLDIIDLFDYSKSWRADPSRRSAEKEAMLGILEGLENIIQNRGPPNPEARKVAVATLQEALVVIKTNSKNHRLTSGEAFLANAAELLEKDGGRVIAVDVVGFWAAIQTNLARAHQEYMLKISALAAEKERVMLEESLKADDLIKQRMAEKVEAIIKILGGYLPVLEFNSQERQLVNQEGGDEIVFYIHGDYDWDALAKKLSSQNLGVRIMAVIVHHDNEPKPASRDLGLALTEVMHARFGEAYITAQQGDQIVKALEKLGVVSAVVSQELNEQGEPEWFVYYQNKRTPYAKFYAELKEKAEDVNLAAGHQQKAPHGKANKFIRDNLPRDLRENPEHIRNYKQVEGYGVRARIIPIRGLFNATGQFAHIGLGQVYGEAVIYVDADYAENQTVLTHELYEIAKWEAKREELGLDPQEMRQWILDNLEEAKRLAEQWHNQAPRLDILFFAASRRMQGLLDLLAEAAGLERHVEFEIERTGMSYAFVNSDGKVHIVEGLFDLVQKGIITDREFAALLAHEIAHLVENDALISYALKTLGLSGVDEEGLEIARWILAAEILTKAGLSYRDVINFAEKVQAGALDDLMVQLHLDFGEEKTTPAELINAILRHQIWPAQTMQIRFMEEATLGDYINYYDQERDVNLGAGKQAEAGVMEVMTQRDPKTIMAAIKNYAPGYFCTLDWESIPTESQLEELLKAIEYLNAQEQPVFVNAEIGLFFEPYSKTWLFVGLDVGGSTGQWGRVYEFINTIKKEGRMPQPRIKIHSHPNERNSIVLSGGDKLGAIGDINTRLFICAIAGFLEYDDNGRKGAEMDLKKFRQRLIEISQEFMDPKTLLGPAEVTGQSKTGGIDFRFLPIVIQSMDNLKASIRSIPASSLRRIDLTQEWSDIERLVNSGITPSAERLKDYFSASCFKGNLDSDRERIVSCISDILRMEEESCSLTDSTLKDILVVLGSGRSQEELKLAFAN